MTKQFITEAARMQKLAGIITESEYKQLSEMEDIASKLEAAGLNFNDGILGGVGSGGGGYYDSISDKISGYNLDKFDENEFNKWYDGFDKDSFNSFTYEKEFAEDNEYDIDYDIISNIKPGIYNVGEPAYGGFAEIHSNGDITLYATPTLSDGDGSEFNAIFTLNSDGSVKPEMSKEEVKNRLQQNVENPRAGWGIV
jgi:hypothetical protein